MNPDSVPEPVAANGSPDPEREAVAMAVQQAIRNRAIDTINADQARPPAPLSQRLLIVGLTLSAMLVFVLLVNFGVTGMRKIMDIWYPGSITGRSEPPPLSPDQPMFITIDPPSQNVSGSNVSSSTTDRH